MNRLENKDLDKLWNDTKQLLLRYVNLDREEPFTEGDLFVGLLSLSTQIIHRVDRKLWTLACNFDSLDRASKNAILRCSFLDSDTLEMSNLPKVLDSVKLEHGDIDTESIAFIIKDGVDEKDLEKVLCELLIGYDKEFAIIANQVLHSVLEALRD